MPKFLQDKPTEEDILGGTHEKLTKSLKTIIETLNNSKSIKNIIGLFGDWGSGKSSIIKQLDKEENYKVFEFDSWSHKDEFLKRAFLIELTKKINFHEKRLENIGYINSKYKNINSIDFLSKKNIVKTLDVKPESNFIGLGFFGLLIFFLVLFNAIGINLFKILFTWASPILSLKLFEGFKNIYFQYLDIIYFIFLFIIIGLFILFYLHFKEDKPIGNKGIKGLLDYILFKKIDYTETSTSSENEDFSNYDYQEYFTKIVKTYIKENENYNTKLIIVLDNLDRVDDDIVLNSISLIQTTIEGIKLEDENIFSKLFFILPIDKKRLKEVFEKLIKLDDKEKDKIKDNFTEGFIDKTFSVIMDIPSLEQSDWREFFKNKLFEAFKDNIEENRDDCFKRLGGSRIIDDLVASFYSFVRSNNKKNTPREIINFINELVSNYIYWNKSIIFEKQGEYILYKRYKFLNDEILQSWLDESGKYNKEIVKQIFKTDDINDILFLNDCILSLKDGNLDKFYENFNKIENLSNKDKLIQNSFDSILGDTNIGINIIGNMINVIIDSNEISDIYKHRLKNWLNDEFGFYPEFVKNIDKKSSEGVLKILNKYHNLDYLKNGLTKSIIESIILSNKPEK